jgi:uncharacterized protein (TIGR02246 family)
MKTKSHRQTFLKQGTMLVGGLLLLGTSLPAQENKIIAPAAPAPARDEAAPGPQALARDSTDDARIRSVISSYQQALNGKNVEGIMRLFTEDGVTMIQGAPTSVGTASVRKFYEVLFKTLDIHIEFQIAEVVQVSSEWVFVRCTSQGTVKVISDSSNNSSAGQELFILKKQAGGSWRIARYAGSSTK